MKRSMLFLIALLLAVIGCVASAQIPAGLKVAYKLAWFDDFNGSALNTAVWKYRTGKRFLSVQRPENVSVKDGNLVISLEANVNHMYTAGGIISRESFHYGYFEARVKILAARGWHSSFWMMRDASPGTGRDAATIELDAMENRSIDLHSYAATVHRWAPPHRASPSFHVKAPDLSQDFHVIGCEYAPDVIRFFFDGQLVDTVPWTGEPQGDVNVWLTSVAEEMGPQHGVDDSRLPGKMLVDWVRVYTK